MNQRTAFIISGAVTAFVLVLVGALVTYVTQANGSAAQVASAVAAQATPQPDQVTTLTPDREAAYRQTLDLANERLRQAADQINQANAQIERQKAQGAAPAQPVVGQPRAMQAAPATADAPSPAAPAEAVVPTAPAYPVSADAAASIALGVAPGTRIQRTPELVSFQGAVAYEVVLDRGTVHVDATTGKVLHNGATPTLLASATEGRAGHVEQEDDEFEDDEHEDEHEGREREVRRTEGRGRSASTATSRSTSPRLRVEARGREDDDD